MPPSRLTAEALDVDAVTIVTWGTVGWGLASVACLIFLSRLRADGHAWWLATCLSGAVLGLLGIVYCRRRRQNLSRPSAPPLE